MAEAGRTISGGATRGPATAPEDLPDTAPGPRLARLREAAVPWLFMAPYLILFAAFLLAPALAGVSISFAHWGILGSPEWAGLDNYRAIAADPLFWRSLWNTAYFMVLAALPLMVVGLSLALLLNAGLRGTVIARTLVFMPHVVMVSAIGILWTWMYEQTGGLINHYMELLGLPRLAWLSSTDWSMPALAITTLWWTVNINMLIYLAALQDIPAELHEAAELDGAGAFARFWYVTLPLLWPVTALVLALTIVSSWRVFGQAYVMTQGGPETSTFVIVQYIYQTAFQNFEMGPAAAAAVVLLVITLTFALVQLKAMRVL